MAVQLPLTFSLCSMLIHPILLWWWFKANEALRAGSANNSFGKMIRIQIPYMLWWLRASNGCISIESYQCSNRNHAERWGHQRKRAHRNDSQHPSIEQPNQSLWFYWWIEGSLEWKAHRTQRLYTVVGSSLQNELKQQKMRNNFIFVRCEMICSWNKWITYNFMKPSDSLKSNMYLHTVLLKFMATTKIFQLIRSTSMLLR